jgi:membrane-bound lytic murein transglycosylase MltF
MIRVYAPFSRSLYFNDNGRERGIAVELVRDWERYLNIKYAKQLGKRPLTIYIAPATRDKLLLYLGEGLADVAIGNLTVTDERLKEADFVPGDEGRRTINEIVVTGPKSPELKSLDDLSGKTVHVRKASSYYESLQKLNERFKQDSKPEVQLILVPDALEDEDAGNARRRPNPVRGSRRLEGSYVGAAIAQDHGADRSGSARRRKDWLGDP